ncbi:DnaA/Hda family protein [Methylopila sp. M107]|uniref:DnaA ATPase domain-containing protein n=1 Tax=Methylopila sp. M107 TaxID=1101190 RepID=UPI00035F4D6D|nr:DnaA/Hda family protein [Methylopila sp. M107]
MPQETPRQYPLDLPVEPRLGAEDYLVGPANRAAHALITGWPAWPDRIVLLVGPEGAGKTHLGAIWAAASGAAVTAGAAAALDQALGADEPTVLLDDCDAEDADETALFHLMNTIRERRGFLLLTARGTPSLLWPRLPDLASRVRALPVARLDAPDETTAKAVLIKLLDDRQLRVEADVVDFIARRTERSIGAIRELVRAIDRESLARGRAVGRGLASDVLARIWDRGD